MEGILDGFAGRDRRVRWNRLDYSKLPETSQRWWISGQPVRCQDGTPIFAFAAGFEHVPGRFVLRADCDMLFRDEGWVREGIGLLSSGQYDLIAPPRLGDSPLRVSSRAMLFDWPTFSPRFLPMRAARLDWLRRIHRRFHGRPVCLSFEESIMQLVRNGQVRFSVLAPVLGASLHVARVADIAEPGFQQVVEQWENGFVPARQLEHGWDFLPAGWGHSDKGSAVISGNRS